jgi:hypothetical protein
MARVAANHVHDAPATDDLAALANPLDAGSNFHDFHTVWLLLRGKVLQYKRQPPKPTRAFGKEISPLARIMHVRTVSTSNALLVAGIRIP